MVYFLRSPALTCVLMTEPPERLNRAMEQRRLDLKLEWRDLAGKAGISYESVRVLRKTGQSRPLTKRRLEEALRWTAGSIDDVLAGGEPKIAAMTPEQVAEERAHLLAALAKLDEIERGNRDAG